MKNIILFAMSTFTTTNTQTYSLDAAARSDVDQKWSQLEVDQCVYSLEPVVRLIMQNEKDTPSELIMLCTPQVWDVNRDRKTKEPADFIADGRNWGSISPVDYLISKLYISGLTDGTDKKISNGKGIDPKAVNHFTTGTDQQVEYFTVPVEREASGVRNDILSAMDIIVKEIRAQSEKERENHDDGGINLYIAANGGFRDTFLILTGIISIVKLDGISIKGIFSTDTTSREIINVRQSFDMFGFVSGLNEFDVFGDVTTIKDYLYRKYHNDKSRVDHDPMIKAMDDISKGLNCCNALIFQDGIRQLREVYKGNIPSEIFDDPEFRIARNDIKSDYGPVLEGDRFRMIDVIERCFRKGRIQQALTFAESKISDDLFNAGVLYFRTDDRTNVKVRDSDNNIIVDKNNRKALEYIRYGISVSKKFWVQDPVNFMMEEYYRKIIKPQKLRKSEDKSEAEWIFINRNLFDELYDAVVNPNVNYQSAENIAEKLGIFAAEQMLFQLSNVENLLTIGIGKHAVRDGIKMYTEIPENDEIARKYRLLTKHLFYLYSIVKATRNTYNHSNGSEQAPVEQVETLISIFIDYCKEILRYAESVRHRAYADTDQVNESYKTTVLLDPSS